jgi:hypothetical protein
VQLFFKIFFLLLLIIPLYSCNTSNSGMGGVGGDSTLRDTEKDATYLIDCEREPICNNPTLKFSREGKDTKYIECIWTCGNYKGIKRGYVDLEFKKPVNGCWQFSSELLDKEGTCK